MGGATQEGTFSYLKKFPSYLKEFYRFDGNFFFSTLGLGTFKKEPYREEHYEYTYEEAIRYALSHGVNFLDTASNYRYGESEKEIGRVLAQMQEEGSLTRSEVILASKAGFIPLCYPFPVNPYRWIEEVLIEGGLATPEEIVLDQHCLSPAFLKWSLEQSLRNLQVDHLDIFFIHNPEMQLGTESKEVVMNRVKEAFALCETLVEQGKIGWYGVASWNGLLYEEENVEYLSLYELTLLAREVAPQGDHFRYIQAPYNIAKPHAMRYTNQKLEDGRYYTLFQAAHRLGLSCVASSPLLQMNLFSKPFAPSVKKVLKTELLSDVQTALQFARSSPCVSSVFGAKEAQHVKENLWLAHTPLPSVEGLNTLWGEDKT